jgi:hypothetical protein
MKSTGFVIFNILIDTVFFVDTFLQFFRAYRDENGCLVYSLTSIRRNYIRSGFFFFNLIAAMPTTLLAYFGNSLDDKIIFLLDLFKVLRLVGARKLLKKSHLFNVLWERINVQTALTLKFLFMISLVSVSNTTFGLALQVKNTTSI